MDRSAHSHERSTTTQANDDEDSLSLEKEIESAANSGVGWEGVDRLS